MVKWLIEIKEIAKLNSIDMYSKNYMDAGCRRNKMENCNIHLILPPHYQIISNVSDVKRCLGKPTKKKLSIPSKKLNAIVLVCDKLLSSLEISSPHEMP